MKIPQNMDNVQSMAKLIASMIGIILMVVTYTYIQKLEQISCKCSEHPYRNYIKSYIMFAVVFLLFTMFVTPATATRMFGTGFAIVLTVAELLFGLATFVFLIYALQYVRFLMKEKCKCSEDLRREVLYVWSILQIILISINFILPWIVGIALSGLGVVLSGSKDLLSLEPGVVREATMNPLKSMRRLPASLKKTSKMFRK